MKGIIKISVLLFVCAVSVLIPAVHSESREISNPGHAVAAELPPIVDSSVKSVTIYSDRAMVVRSAKVALNKGTHDLVFDDLPPALRWDTVRAKGAENIRVTNLRIKSRPIARPDDPEIRKAQEKVEKWEDVLREIKDNMGILAKKTSFLDSIRLKAGENASGDLERKLDVENLEKVLNFLTGNYDSAADEKRRLDAENKKAGEELSAARRELKALQSKMSLSKVYAIVTVVAAEKTAGEIELNYIVGNACWYAEYDIRATIDVDDADIEYYGVIYQRSGEDWTNAQIMLTTARPALASKPPELRPRFLQIYQSRSKSSSAGGGKGRYRSQDGDGELQPGFEIAKRKLEEPAQSRVLMRAGLAVTYVLPGRETIPSSPEPYRTLISAVSLKPEKAFVSVPRLSDNVYLQAEFSNRTELAFLPGKANIFLGPDYIGTTSMPQAAPAEKFKINFGVDQQFKIKRERIKRFEEDLGKKKKRITYEYKITVQSFKDLPATVVLKDRIPVSTHESIEVKLLKTNVKPEHEINRKDKTYPAVVAFKEKGIIEWRLELAPDPEKKHLVGFSYKVEFPAGLRIFGLE